MYFFIKQFLEDPKLGYDNNDNNNIIKYYLSLTRP
jgi:hypothetical protein